MTVDVDWHRLLEFFLCKFLNHSSPSPGVWQQTQECTDNPGWLHSSAKGQHHWNPIPISILDARQWATTKIRSNQHWDHRWIQQIDSQKCSSWWLWGLYYLCWKCCWQGWGWLWCQSERYARVLAFWNRSFEEISIESKVPHVCVSINKCFIINWYMFEHNKIILNLWVSVI